jgi:hypothetical protein
MPPSSSPSYCLMITGCQTQKNPPRPPVKRFQGVNDSVRETETEKESESLSFGPIFTDGLDWWAAKPNQRNAFVCAEEYSRWKLGDKEQEVCGPKVAVVTHPPSLTHSLNLVSLDTLIANRSIAKKHLIKVVLDFSYCDS